MDAGCSLAESDHPGAALPKCVARYPGAPVVTNMSTTTADVRGGGGGGEKRGGGGGGRRASDICCTSANAVQIIRALDADTIIMTPDQYLAQNVAAQVPEKRHCLVGRLVHCA